MLPAGASIVEGLNLLRSVFMWIRYSCASRIYDSWIFCGSLWNNAVFIATLIKISILLWIAMNGIDFTILHYEAYLKLMSKALFIFWNMIMYIMFLTV